MRLGSMPKEKPSKYAGGYKGLDGKGIIKPTHAAHEYINQIVLPGLLHVKDFCLSLHSTKICSEVSRCDAGS
ncbi:MAG: hypothetical protein N3E47_01825 [Candidatus Bathyarchaeota archaeon]|nr:hypothetical protein [Candidatus Bathyarchaeota archaeon]